MRRWLLAAGLLLALASAGSTQSTPADEDLSPMEFFFSLGKQRQSEADKAGPDKDPGKAQQTGAKPDAKTPVAAKTAAANRKVDSLQQCLSDWDVATHMTRAEWARTCRRVIANRVKSLNEQPEK